MKTVVTVPHVRGVTLRQVLFSTEMPGLGTQHPFSASVGRKPGHSSTLDFHQDSNFFPLMLKKVLVLQDIDPAACKDLRSTG